MLQNVKDSLSSYTDFFTALGLQTVTVDRLSSPFCKNKYHLLKISNDREEKVAMALYSDAAGVQKLIETARKALSDLPSVLINILSTKPRLIVNFHLVSADRETTIQFLHIEKLFQLNPEIGGEVFVNCKIKFHRLFNKETESRIDQGDYEYDI